MKAGRQISSFKMKGLYSGEYAGLEEHVLILDGKSRESLKKQERAGITDKMR
jgi:hypothetical protein